MLVQSSIKLSLQRRPNGQMMNNSRKRECTVQCTFNTSSGYPSPVVAPHWNPPDPPPCRYISMHRRVHLHM